MTPVLQHCMAPPAARPEYRPFSLADLAFALCAGLVPTQGLEALLDRVEELA